jgi:Rrf2 family protein
MKLTRTAAYAVHALVYIAGQDNGQPVVGHAAAAELRIPLGFFLRILVTLSRSGLLRSIQGPNGGYNLGKPAKTITLLDILEAVEGPLMGHADPASNPPGALDEKLLEVITAVTESVRKEFKRVTLADLAGGRKVASKQR